MFDVQLRIFVDVSLIPKIGFIDVSMHRRCSLQLQLQVIRQLVKAHLTYGLYLKVRDIPRCKQHTSSMCIRNQKVVATFNNREIIELRGPNGKQAHSESLDCFLRAAKTQTIICKLRTYIHVHTLHTYPYMHTQLCVYYRTSIYAYEKLRWEILAYCHGASSSASLFRYKNTWHINLAASPLTHWHTHTHLCTHMVCTPGKCFSTLSRRGANVGRAAAAGSGCEMCEELRSPSASTMFNFKCDSPHLALPFVHPPPR